ncbi:MAG: efflux RND transporter permease subunit, partial [Candidatus Competibacteraceae bacterium]|nr:efflux RND transporter permease subunit [Candidatus Competibacteraceae bacterium]
TAANLLMVVFLALGISALPTLQRETFPDFTPQEVEVSVPYPGASAQEVEEAVCLRLEDGVDVVAEAVEVRCEAREGLGRLVARMQEGADFARFLDDINTEVEAIDDFPDPVERATVRQLGRTDRVVAIAVTGPMAEPDLKAYAEDLKERLKQLPQVSQVTVAGFSQHQLRVAVPARVLRQYDLSMGEIAESIARQSVDLPLGSLTTRDQEILVRFADQRRTPRELARLIILEGPEGAQVRLGQLATITDRFELDEERVLLDGQRAALLQITKTKAEDTLEVVAAVKAFVDRERLRAPPRVAFVLTQDLASIVRDRLTLLVRNGLQGLLLVFGVMWLFFRLRFAFWVAMGLPVAFLGGLFLMGLLGYSINMITMVALLIALGLLMDDAIVIAENIAAQLSRGKSALTAAIDGTRQVAPGVLASFLTTVAVFGPLAFLQGDIGKVLKVLPVVLILVLAVSLVEAFCILPHHLGHSLAKAPVRTSRFRTWFDARLEWLREAWLGRAVDWAVGQRYLFTGLVIAIFLATVGALAGGVVKFRAFPEIDGDVIEARLLLPQGTPLWRTQQLVARITAALERVNAGFTPRQPQGRPLVRHISVQYGQNPDAFETGPHVATVRADLLTAEIRTVTLLDVLNAWRQETGPLPDTLALSFKEPVLGPGGIPIEIRLQGPDLAQLKAASLELQDWLAHYQGTFDLSDDLRPGKPELRLRLTEGALALGLDASYVARELRSALFGTTAAEIQLGRESYEIDVRLADADDRGDLEDFRIRAPNGALIPLSAVAQIREDRGLARIQRIDGRRTVTVRGDLDSRLANAREIIADSQERFLPQLTQRYPQVTVVLEGQSAESAKTGWSLARGLLLGLLGIFVLLSFQFRSYLEPLAVMTAIPLALVGVVWGHWLLGLELSMPSMMGFVSLAGIVVNDSILLVEFLKLRVREGLTVVEAAQRASRERFRAVLLTSLTTMAGLLPLLAEKSLQAQVLIPLATSIVFGLLATTALVLLVVPAFYGILNDLGLIRAAPAQQTEAAKALT